MNYCCGGEVSSELKLTFSGDQPETDQVSRDRQVKCPETGQVSRDRQIKCPETSSVQRQVKCPETDRSSVQRHLASRDRQIVSRDRQIKCPETDLASRDRSSVQRQTDQVSRYRSCPETDRSSVQIQIVSRDRSSVQRQTDQVSRDRSSVQRQIKCPETDRSSVQRQAKCPETDQVSRDRSCPETDLVSRDRSSVQRQIKRPETDQVSRDRSSVQRQIKCPKTDRSSVQRQTGQVSRDRQVKCPETDQVSRDRSSIQRQTDQVSRDTGQVSRETEVKCPKIGRVVVAEMSSKVQPSDTKVHHTVGPDTKVLLNSKGKNLHCSYWTPHDSQNIRGLVFLCHGFGEHLQWYEDLALHLSATGLLAFGHDHVGHGRSEGIRGYVECVDDYVNDVLHHCDDLCATHPSLPCFIVGHSMGGMIAIKCAMARPQFFTGVVLMGPLIKVNSAEATAPKIFLAKIVSRILPYLTVAKLKMNHITRDEDMMTRLKRDPLRYRGGIRARWAMAVIETLLYFEHHIPEVEWPFLILHGEKDLLCSPEGSLLLHEQARSSDKTIKVFPLAYHHLYLEVREIRHEALQDTVDWITARISPSIKISTVPYITGYKMASTIR
nr:uncharacterized protein LOC128701577 isoform X2 [Cherax quadricarinatus]